MHETFDNFMNHKREFEFLKNVQAIELGNGYSYVSKPISPLLKKFTLKFTGFRYYFNSDGTPDSETNKSHNNFKTLLDFYETMNMCETFIYNDEIYGPLTVRFAEPLKDPGTSGPFGAVNDFQVVLQEVAE